MFPTRSASAAEIIEDPIHISELAVYTQQTANSVCWELHRFHQQQPDYPFAYRDAKEIWSLAGMLRDQLQAGPVDSANAAQQLARMNMLLTGIEKATAKWGDGLRPAPLPAELMERRGVVVGPGAGVGVNVPFFGIRLSAPRIAVADEVVAVPAPPHRAFHPNSRGSRRSLEREIFTLRTALAYLTEDANLTIAVAPPADAPPGTPTPIAPTALPPASPPRPAPVQPSNGPDLESPVKVFPSSAATPVSPAAKK